MESGGDSNSGGGGGGGGGDDGGGDGGDGGSGGSGEGGVEGGGEGCEKIVVKVVVVFCFDMFCFVSDSFDGCVASVESTKQNPPVED